MCTGRTWQKTEIASYNVNAVCCFANRRKSTLKLPAASIKGDKETQHNIGLLRIYQVCHGVDRRVKTGIFLRRAWSES